MQATFKKQLEDILDDVADEEQVTNQLRVQLEARERRCVCGVWGGGQGGEALGGAR